jgi:hypothetical protein
LDYIPGCIEYIFEIYDNTGKSQYSSKENSIRIEELKENTEYKLEVFAIIEDKNT